MWYVLAAANALSGDSDLVAGTSLKVPDTGVAKNDSSTFKPYNPNEIIGSTAPSLPYIPPASSNQCAVIAVVIVAIVVIALTYGSAAPYLSSMLTPIATLATTTGITTVGAIAGGFVAGVAGSIASQVVGKALGVVDYFSLRAAVANGFATAITMGVGAATTAMGTVGDMIRAGQWGRAAAVAVVNSSSSYVGNKLAGVKDNSFSWKSIAASAVSTMVSASISNKLNFNSQKPLFGSGDYAQDVMNDSIGGVVSLHTRRAFGFDDKADYGSILANAFGTATGNGLVRAMQGGSFLGQAQKSPEAIERKDWGLSRSQQEQLHQLPDAQQQVFFDKKSSGASTLDALTAAVVIESRNSEVIAETGAMSESGGSSRTIQEIAASTYSTHAVGFKSRFTNNIYAPDPNWDDARTAQWIEEYRVVDATLGDHAHNVLQIQANVSDTPILDHTQQSVADLRDLGRRNIENATSKPEAAFAATAYAINEVSTVFMEGVIGTMGLFSSSARRYQAIDGLDRFLSSKPKDIAASVWNMPREEKLRQTGAALVGLAAPAGLVSGSRVGANRALVSSEVGALQRIAANNLVVSGSVARMARIDELSTVNYNRVLSQDLAGADYVYRSIPEKMVDIYRAQGGISGRGGASTFFSLEGGATPLMHKLGAQLIDEPQVLLKIPTSELRNSQVPRPFGYELSPPTFGREYFVNSYPKYGSGGFRQFTGTTSTFSDSWIVSPWGK